MKLLLFFLPFFILSQELKRDSLLQHYQTKNPNTSLLLSILLPGAGQIYNEDYTKAALLFGSFTFFVSESFNNNQKINDIKSGKLLFDSSVEKSRQIDRYFEKRNVAIWRAFAIYLLSVLDAYIRAQLFGFDQIMDSNNWQQKFTMKHETMYFHLSIGF